MLVPQSQTPELSVPPGILLEMQTLMLTLNLGKPKDGSHLSESS